MNDPDRQAHIKWQAAYFDEKAPYFVQPIPPAVQQRTKQIVGSASLSPHSRVLDVGTGAGVLIDHFLQSGVRKENIVGCDLSSGMLEQARKLYPEVTFWQGDIIDFPASFGEFDCIFFNACFGNLLQPQRVLTHINKMLKVGGRVVISHPMGAGFVKELQEQDQRLIAHLLPDSELLQQWCKACELVLDTFIDEPQLYIAVLRRRN
jgi:SAM-dependent methyltransferase